MGVKRPLSASASGAFVAAASGGRTRFMGRDASRWAARFHPRWSSYSRLLWGVILRARSFYHEVGQQPDWTEWEGTMRRGWCAAAVIALALSTVPASALELRMLASWDRNNPAVPLLAEGFARNVE